MKGCVCANEKYLIRYLTCFTIADCNTEHTENLLVLFGWSCISSLPSALRLWTVLQIGIGVVTVRHAVVFAIP